MPDIKLTDDEVRIMANIIAKSTKTGHWIRGKYTEDNIRYNDSSYKCSRCARIVDFKERFCPDCGSRMVEPQEEREK